MRHFSLSFKICFLFFTLYSLRFTSYSLAADTSNSCPPVILTSVNHSYSSTSEACVQAKDPQYVPNDFDIDKTNLSCSYMFALKKDIGGTSSSGKPASAVSQFFSGALSEFRSPGSDTPAGAKNNEKRLVNLLKVTDSIKDKKRKVQDFKTASVYRTGSYRQVLEDKKNFACQSLNKDSYFSDDIVAYTCDGNSQIFTSKDEIVGHTCRPVTASEICLVLYPNEAPPVISNYYSCGQGQCYFTRFPEAKKIFSFISPPTAQQIFDTMSYISGGAVPVRVGTHQQDRTDPSTSKLIATDFKDGALPSYRHIVHQNNQPPAVPYKDLQAPLNQINCAQPQENVTPGPDRSFVNPIVALIKGVFKIINGQISADADMYVQFPETLKSQTKKLTLQSFYLLPAQVQKDTQIKNVPETARTSYGKDNGDILNPGNQLFKATKLADKQFIPAAWQRPKF